MQDVELTGTDYEMGQQYGRLLEQAGFSPQPISPEKRQFVRDCEPAVREHAPHLLEELRGIADAGDWDAERIEAIPLALEWESGCSVVAVSGDHTVDGSPVFGRNYDFFRSFADYSELYRTHPEDRLASVSCSDHWVGRHDGINEAGLAIGHTFVPNHITKNYVRVGDANSARYLSDRLRRSGVSRTDSARAEHEFPRC